MSWYIMEEAERLANASVRCTGNQAFREGLLGRGARHSHPVPPWCFFIYRSPGCACKVDNRLTIRRRSQAKCSLYSNELCFKALPPDQDQLISWRELRSAGFLSGASDLRMLT